MNRSVSFIINSLVKYIYMYMILNVLKITIFFFKTKIAAWKLLTETALEKWVDCSWKSFYYAHTDQNCDSSQEVECCCGRCLFGDYKMSKKMPQYSVTAKTVFCKTDPRLKRAAPPALNSTSREWICEGQSARWLLAPSCLLSLPPSLSRALWRKLWWQRAKVWLLVAACVPTSTPQRLLQNKRSVSRPQQAGTQSSSR